MEIFRGRFFQGQEYWIAVLFLQHGSHGDDLLSLGGALACGANVGRVNVCHCRRNDVSFISNNAYNSNIPLVSLKLPWHEST